MAVGQGSLCSLSLNRIRGSGFRQLLILASSSYVGERAGNLEEIVCPSGELPPGAEFPMGVIGRAHLVGSEKILESSSYMVASDENSGAFAVIVKM